MIKKLLKCVREYKKASILTPLCMIMEVAMEVIMPLLIAKIIDDGINKGDMRNILIMGSLLVACAFVSLFFGVLSGKNAAIASSGFAKNLRHDMFYNVQNFSFANIDKFSTASIVTRLTTDVSNVQMAYQMSIRMAVRSPMMLTFALIMAFSINHKLSLIFLGCIPVLAIGLFLIMSRAHPIFKRVFKTYDKLNNIVGENLHGIRVVKSYVREEYEDKKFKGVSEDIYRYFTKAEKLLAMNMPLMQLCMYTCMILISWLGAKTIVNTAGGELTTGTLMSLISYAMQVLMSLMMLSMVFVMIVISRASAERVVEILDEQSTLTNPANPVLEVPNGDVRFENVSFKYSTDSENYCLKNVNLDIKSGETVGILGGTGSSKTTLVQLISRLYDATEGVVYVGGVNIKDYDIETLRNQVTTVLQKNVLFSGTIKENLRWGDENASDEELARVCRLAQADGFISSFPQGYDTHIEQGGTNVSGGQKQRICIARALLKKPKVLILDDSTSAVDTATDASIRKAFREEIPGTTKLIIAQRVASVEDADKIILMDNGQVCAVGTHDELLANNEIYQEVYYSQKKGSDSNEAI